MNRPVEGVELVANKLPLRPSSLLPAHGRGFWAAERTGFQIPSGELS